MPKHKEELLTLQRLRDEISQRKTELQALQDQNDRLAIYVKANEERNTEATKELNETWTRINAARKEAADLEQTNKKIVEQAEIGKAVQTLAAAVFKAGVGPLFMWPRGPIGR